MPRHREPCDQVEDGEVDVMRMYDRICPVCGCLNRKLYLEETGGMMECERCGSISRVSFGNEVFSVSISSKTERCIKMEMTGYYDSPVELSAAIQT